MDIGILVAFKNEIAKSNAEKGTRFGTLRAQKEALRK